MTNITELPNPFTPLAFLPPALARQLEVTRYILAATLGAYVWDIALNLGNDYTLLFKHRVRLPTIVYLLSRAFTLAYALTSFVFQVASVENCEALQLAVGLCFVLSQTATAMLFLLRATAVWYPSKIACAVFSVLWIAVLGAGIAFALGLHGEHIGPTKHCITVITPVNTEVVVCIILPPVNDTAIFLAINYRILAHTIVTDSPMVRLRIFFGGRGLSALTKALLQSGQQFYLLAVAANLALLVVLKLPQIAVYRLMPVPFFALINAMTCLVFRRIKFGLISPDGTSKISIPGPSVDFHATENSSSPSFPYCRTLPTATGFGSDTLDVRVEIGRFEKDANASQEISKPIPILA